MYLLDAKQWGEFIQSHNLEYTNFDGNFYEMNHAQYRKLLSYYD